MQFVARTGLAKCTREPPNKTSCGMNAGKGAASGTTFNIWKGFFSSFIPKKKARRSDKKSKASLMSAPQLESHRMNSDVWQS